MTAMVDATQAARLSAQALTARLGHGTETAASIIDLVVEYAGLVHEMLTELETVLADKRIQVKKPEDYDGGFEQMIHNAGDRLFEMRYERLYPLQRAWREVFDAHMEGPYDEFYEHERKLREALAEFFDMVSTGTPLFDLSMAYGRLNEAFRENRTTGYSEDLAGYKVRLKDIMKRAAALRKLFNASPFAYRNKPITEKQLWRRAEDYNRRPAAKRRAAVAVASATAGFKAAFDSAAVLRTRQLAELMAVAKRRNPHRISHVFGELMQDIGGAFDYLAKGRVSVARLHREYVEIDGDWQNTVGRDPDSLKPINMLSHISTAFNHFYSLVGESDDIHAQLYRPTKASDRAVEFMQKELKSEEYHKLLFRLADSLGELKDLGIMAHEAWQKAAPFKDEKEQAQYEKMLADLFYKEFPEEHGVVYRMTPNYLYDMMETKLFDRGRVKRKVMHFYLPEARHRFFDETHPIVKKFDRAAKDVIDTAEDIEKLNKSNPFLKNGRLKSFDELAAILYEADIIYGEEVTEKEAEAMRRSGELAAAGIREVTRHIEMPFMASVAGAVGYIAECMLRIRQSLATTSVFDRFGSVRTCYEHAMPVLWSLKDFIDTAPVWQKFEEHKAAVDYGEALHNVAYSLSGLMAVGASEYAAVKGEEPSVMFAPVIPITGDRANIEAHFNSYFDRLEETLADLQRLNDHHRERAGVPQEGDGDDEAWYGIALAADIGFGEEPVFTLTVEELESIQALMHRIVDYSDKVEGFADMLRDSPPDDIDDAISYMTKVGYRLQEDLAAVDPDLDSSMLADAYDSFVVDFFGMVERTIKVTDSFWSAGHSDGRGRERSEEFEDRVEAAGLVEAAATFRARLREINDFNPFLRKKGPKSYAALGAGTLAAMLVALGHYDWPDDGGDDGAGEFIQKGIERFASGQVPLEAIPEWCREVVQDLITEETRMVEEEEAA